MWMVAGWLAAWLPAAACCLLPLPLLVAAHALAA
jgi:hypothetical protein